MLPVLGGISGSKRPTLIIFFPIRVKVLDEIVRWSKSAGVEIPIAKGRTLFFFGKKAPVALSKPRGWFLDAFAAGMLLFGFCLGIAILGQDPPFPVQYEFPLSPSKNPLGEFGTWISKNVHHVFGLGSFLVLGAWFTMVFGLILRNHFFLWTLRFFGWVMLIPSACLLAREYQEYFPMVSASGPGGSLGLFTSHYLEQLLSEPWHVIASFTMTILGSILAFPAFWRVLGISLQKLGTVLLKALVQIVRFIQLILSPFQPLATRMDQLEDLAITKPAGSQKALAIAPDLDVENGNIPIFHHGSNTSKKEAKKVALESSSNDSYELPSLSLLEDPKPLSLTAQEQQLRERAQLLEKTFFDFGLNVKVVGINTGPVITQFEISLETGLRVHKVTRLNDDIALNLKVPSVRIVAPIPGKNTVGIEVPNELRAEVRLKEVLEATGTKLANYKIPLFLGKDAEGRPLVGDLADMPHLLIAGSTGTGKSVCMNTIILSMLMTRTPDDIRMIMIDPKVVELSNFTKLPHMMHPVVHDMKKAEAILCWAVEKMEERYELLRRAKVRNIAGYNELGEEEVLRRVEPVDEVDRARIPAKMPYIVIFIDEMADLMMTMKKEVETHIIRLAQKSRAAGIHLIVATQKPTVDVITGLIKSNLPARICFKVVNKSDSRVVLDEMGADKLLGKGDMLFLPPGTSLLVRAQGTFASDREITRIVETLEGDPCYAKELMELEIRKEGDDDDLAEKLKNRDELYEAAVEVVIREGRGSCSLLQRALGIGYGRAARLIDFMAEDKIVGTYNGSSAREVVMTMDQWESVRAAR